MPTIPSENTNAPAIMVKEKGADLIKEDWLDGYRGLRVYGVAGLRAIDASIMPTIPSENTNAPAIMVKEKGADLIKEDWLDGYRGF
ncbi:unnamed protein product [Acanthoscelides obtectus]|uniref:Glucose-methanol-choline oxidoreductase C-terminal domain-containing protein n=1 Tax=Acanthoscelides obtectus TaxID=200917 RepID=A0A9P0MBP6_ACAOB|nr:unnamed protein product [Acanthoscelides obtectus]CAK1659678.1 Glucose dehydrogenase [FAD, quinone] [Acanthoscelides obtectus]